MKNDNQNKSLSTIKLFSSTFIISFSFFGAIVMAYISYKMWGGDSTLGLLYGALSAFILVAGIVSALFIWNIEEIASFEVLFLIVAVAFILLWILIAFSIIHEWINYFNMSP